MATIRRSGNGWQVLIRRKNYVGPRSKTFLSRDLAQSWADAVEERTKKVLNDIPVTLGEAINEYINGPLLMHRSAEFGNECLRDKCMQRPQRYKNADALQPFSTFHINQQSIMGGNASDRAYKTCKEIY